MQFRAIIYGITTGLMLLFCRLPSCASFARALKLSTAPPSSHMYRNGLSMRRVHRLYDSDAMSDFDDYITATVTTPTPGAEPSIPPTPTAAETIEDIDNRPRVVWEAAASSSVRVKEVRRTAEAYMALPASQYSVLTASQITRLSDTEFKCTLGTMNFFGTKLAPTLYVTVTVKPEEARSEIAVTRAEVSGSDVARQINGAFNISAINIVTAKTSSSSTTSSGEKTLNSDTTLRIEAALPSSTRLPLGLIRRSGNFLMQSTLSIVVPTFVRILAADFKRWSAGDDSRSAVEGAELHP